MLLDTSFLLSSLEKVVISEVLGPEALAAWALGDLPASTLQPYIPAILELSGRYREGGETNPRQEKANEHTLICAYALYYLLVNAAKILHLLAPLVPLLECGAKVLDVGSGPATASIAARLLGEPGIEFTLVDTSRKALELGSRLLARFEGRAIERAKIPDEGSFQLIFACNVLAEIKSSEEFANRLTRLLAPGGVLFIMEPGSFTPTRALMEIRDSILLQQRPLHLLFPCTHTAPCPMRASPTDWCHGELSWARLPLVEQIDRLTGFNKHRLKYSALIMKSGAINSQPGYRVISSAEKTIRGPAAFLCGADHYGPVVLPKRERNDENRAFSKLRQYDLVQIGNRREPPTLDAGTDVCVNPLPFSFENVI